MTKEMTIEQAEQSLLHTYNRYPVVFERGEGMYLYDTEGKRYLDCYAGIAVLAFGHCDKKFNQELKNQIDRLIHVSNLFYNVPAVEASRKVLDASGMDRIFFTNSGTEAIEGALKAARKYRYQRTGRNDGEIIAMDHSFHGRSMGALSVTGTEHYRTPFEPLIGGVRFATFNDLDSVTAAVSERTCAILLETVQGEGGIYPADPVFLEGIRKLCDEKDILLILDEVQCGMGRTGKMFAWQHFHIKPDICALAKALGCGVPVGAFLMTERVAADSLAPGDHGTTYGGNPLVCAAVSTVFDMMKERDILSHVNEITPYLEETLDSLAEEYPFIVARRGLGLMQGLAFAEDTPASEIAATAIQAGLLVITAGGNVLRIVPPLIIERKHIDEMAGILKKVLDGRRG